MCSQFHFQKHRKYEFFQPKNGVEGIQPPQENNNDKLDVGLTEIVSFSVAVADLACTQKTNHMKITEDITLFSNDYVVGAI